jgi:hypothetical protein
LAAVMKLPSVSWDGTLAPYLDAFAEIYRPTRDRGAGYPPPQSPLFSVRINQFDRESEGVSTAKKIAATRDNLACCIGFKEASQLSEIIKSRLRYSTRCSTLLSTGEVKCHERRLKCRGLLKGGFRRYVFFQNAIGSDFSLRTYFPSIPAPDGIMYLEHGQSPRREQYVMWSQEADNSTNAARN